MSGIPHTEANIGRSGRPCLECGQPHTLHWDPIRPKCLSWAADDGHFYKEMPFDTWLIQRITELEAALREIRKVHRLIDADRIAGDALAKDK